MYSAGSVADLDYQGRVTRQLCPWDVAAGRRAEQQALNHLGGLLVELMAKDWHPSLHEYDTGQLEQRTLLCNESAWALMDRAKSQEFRDGSVGNE